MTDRSVSRNLGTASLSQSAPIDADSEVVTNDANTPPRWQLRSEWRDDLPSVDERLNGGPQIADKVPHRQRDVRVGGAQVSCTSETAPGQGEDLGR